MSDERSSSLKLWVAASDMTRFCIYVGLFGLALRISSFTRHGKWSEILLIIIDEEMFVWSKCGDLQNIWSMRVQDFSGLRVGRVILGKQGKSEGFDSCDRPSNLKLDSNRQFFRPCNREIWWMTTKTIGHFFYTTSSFVHTFKSIGEFKLDLQPRNAQFGRNWWYVNPCDLEIWWMTLENNIKQ